MVEFKSNLKEIEISYSPTLINQRKITSSFGASQTLREVFPIALSHREAFTVLFLNRANNTIGHFVASIGGTSGTVADVRLIFQTALKCNASGLILCHNHPSGQLKPSSEDRKLTNKLKEAGKLLDCLVLDHIILTEEGYFSFADEAIL